MTTHCDGVKFTTNAAMLAAACWACLGGGAAYATMIDFSNKEIPGTYNGFQTDNFISSGFHFQVTTDYGSGVSYTSVVDSATETDPNLQHPSPGILWAWATLPDGTARVFIDGGQTFTLNSLDVNWFDHYYSNTYHQWSITGIFADGSTQSVSGILSPDAFVTEALGWSHLKSVTISGHADNYGYIGLDNIDVTVGPAVPEPATWTLLMVGFGCVGGLRRRSRLQDVPV